MRLVSRDGELIMSHIFLSARGAIVRAVGEKFEGSGRVAASLALLVDESW